MTYEDFYKQMAALPADAATTMAVDCAQQAQALSIPFDMTKGSALNAFMDACGANGGKGGCLAPDQRWDPKLSRCVPWGSVQPPKPAQPAPSHGKQCPALLALPALYGSGCEPYGKVYVAVAVALAVAGIWFAARRKATPNRSRSHRRRTR
ncbi:MAG: hypothetical protein WC683_02780 [bacterium]